MGSVLVIDDEQMVCDLLVHALSRVNYSVEAVNNATGGMVKFDSGTYDLVITDVRMPGVDGHTVLKHIRQSRWAGTPVIGVSGTPALLRNNDFDDVLYKPFALKALIEKVAALTRARKTVHAQVA
jgi:DNA-binding response OmpR family regulator